MRGGKREGKGSQRGDKKGKRNRGKSEGQLPTSSPTREVELNAFEPLTIRARSASFEVALVRTCPGGIQAISR